eukprot:508214-Lingulodinium_polyedra.AAC.1
MRRVLRRHGSPDLWPRGAPAPVPPAVRDLPGAPIRHAGPARGGLAEALDLGRLHLVHPLWDPMHQLLTGPHHRLPRRAHAQAWRAVRPGDQTA